LLEPIEPTDERLRRQARRQAMTGLVGGLRSKRLAEICDRVL
jgi:hypothetical protein